jgi:hypothetical protein
MSIIIEGEPMPEACAFCICFRDDSIDGLHCYQCEATLITYGKDDDWIWEKRPNWCPLVELPEKHGDLIDRDALRKEYQMNDECSTCVRDVRKCEYDRNYILMDFCSWLDNAPVVIEAEGETPYRTRYEVGEEHPVAYEIKAEEEE